MRARGTHVWYGVVEGDAREAPFACSFSKITRCLPHFCAFFIVFIRFLRLSRSGWIIFHFFWEFWSINFFDFLGFFFSFSFFCRFLTFSADFVRFWYFSHSWGICSEIQATLDYSYEYEKALVFTNAHFVRNYKLRSKLRINTKRSLYSRAVRLDSGCFQKKVYPDRKWCLTWVVCAVKSRIRFAYRKYTVNWREIHRCTVFRYFCIGTDRRTNDFIRKTCTRTEHDRKRHLSWVWCALITSYSFFVP